MVTKLFVGDIYLCKFLDFKSIHEHEKYIDISLFTWHLALFGPFCCPHSALIVPFLLYVYRVNTALFVSFIALIVPFLFR